LRQRNNAEADGSPPMGPRCLLNNGAQTPSQSLREVGGPTYKLIFVDVTKTVSLLGLSDMVI
jgi:hypothetical protein